MAETPNLRSILEGHDRRAIAEVSGTIYAADYDAGDGTATLQAHAGRMPAHWTRTYSTLGALIAACLDVAPDSVWVDFDDYEDPA